MSVSSRRVGHVLGCICLAAATTRGTAAPSAGYHLVYGTPHPVAAEETYLVSYPSEVAQLNALLTQPPSLSHRQTLSASLEVLGAGKATNFQADDTALHRAVCSLVALPNSAQLAVKVSYRGYVTPCHLVIGDGPKPAALDPAVRAFALATNREFIFQDLAFQTFLRQNGLIMSSTESPLAFAYRAFQFVKTHCSYGPSPSVVNVVSIATTRQGNCGDLSEIFAGILRANKIPARLLMGRWACPGGNAGEVDAECHAQSEFWVDDIGWIPVDMTSAVCAKDADDSLSFGRFNGDLITCHIDIDIPATITGFRGSPERINISCLQGPILIARDATGRELTPIRRQGTWQAAVLTK